MNIIIMIGHINYMNRKFSLQNYLKQIKFPRVLIFAKIYIKNPLEKEECRCRRQNNFNVTFHISTQSALYL